MNKKSKIKTKKQHQIPLWVLAPMANITTYPFASQCNKFGADLVWTPMVHTDTILSNWDEANKLINFRNIKSFIIQIVGSDPAKFSKSIKAIEKNGLLPIGYDINAGCPDKNIVKSGCGGSLLKDTNKLIRIVRSAKGSTDLPISVKTRAGYDGYGTAYELVPKLMAVGVNMITVHPRTVRQGYAGKADWSVIKNIHDAHFINQSSAILIGSGDIGNWQEAIDRQKETGCEGVMIGRNALGRPWIFKEIKDRANYDIGISGIKKLALELSEKADSIWGEKGIIESRKHYGWYFRGFPGAKEIRIALMQAENLNEVRKILGKL